MDPGPVMLLVEDNEDDELLMRRAFKVNRFAHEIAVARTGEQAIEWLASATALPSLVLLDLNLPKMSGLDVLREIRRDERTRLLPVVVLTSSKQDEDVIESYSLGANAYVRKPVDFAAFTEAVKTLGLFWLVLNEQPRILR
jgi:two-component system response regulator